MSRTCVLSIGIVLLLTTALSSAEEVGVESQQLDEYGKTVLQYYEAIAAKEYRKAYDMLGQCEISLFSASGSGVGYHPRREYKSWLERQKNIESLAVQKVTKPQPGNSSSCTVYTADKGDAEATMGIRIYCVWLNVKLREEDPARRSGQQARFLSVVRGNDGKIRILGIGTGP